MLDAVRGQQRMENTLPYHHSGRHPFAFFKRFMVKYGIKFHFEKAIYCTKIDVSEFPRWRRRSSLQPRTMDATRCSTFQKM
jgi:hypothetical protein